MVGRVSYRWGKGVPNHGSIQDFELVGRRERDGSRMIVACKSTLTHACVCVPTGGWGHALLTQKILADCNLGQTFQITF